MIRLAILEDHPAIAEGLTALMKGEPDVTVVGTARDSVAAERLIQSQSPDVILCDIRLAGTVDGLEILARHTPGPAFIMLSAYSYPSYYSAAVERGAKGFLSKMAAIDEILTAVRKVAAGGTAFPDAVRRSARAALRPPTPREAQILALVAEGRSNAEIAELLTLRIKTVESQLRRMFDRYDVTSRTSLVHVAQRQGWIEGAEWMYGGVGYAGFNSSHAGGGCACWFSRFCLDSFARSIAPEPQIFSVAVLDSAGNLITRIGRFGNADDGKPLVGSAELKSPNSLGGDEVGLFYACYVGTHTDRRIFISDVGNGRILSVKLGYYQEERVAMKDVPDAARK